MRTYGSGSIYQRKDGSYCAELIIGKKSNGKPKKKSIYGKTRAEVSKKLKEYQTETVKFAPANISKLTLEQYMDNWLNKTKKPKLKPSSFDRLENTCVHQIYPFLGFKQFTQITDDEIQEFLNDRSEIISHSSLKKVFDALNAVYKIAVSRKHIDANPMGTVTLPEDNDVKDGDVFFFSEEQIKAIKQEAVRKYKTGKSVYRLGWGFILILNTGMRLGEALALTWDDIDFEKRNIDINKSVATVKNRDAKEGEPKYVNVIQNTPKTKKSIRIISINDNALEALNNLKEINGKHIYVLAKSNGKFNTHRAFDKAFRKIQEHLGYSPVVGTHALRHTFASVLFKNGIDVKTVSAILGHSSTSITYNTYVHLINEQKVEAIRILDNI